MYAISFSGPYGEPDDSGRNYRGLWRVPGDTCWRSCKHEDGQEVKFETAHEAEANAGHRLCNYLSDKARRIACTNQLTMLEG